MIVRAARRSRKERHGLRHERRWNSGCRRLMRLDAVPCLDDRVAGYLIVLAKQLARTTAWSLADQSDDRAKEVAERGALVGGRLEFIDSRDGHGGRLVGS